MDKLVPEEEVKQPVEEIVDITEYIVKKLVKIMEGDLKLDPDCDEWLSKFYKDFLETLGSKAIDKYADNIGRKRLVIVSEAILSDANLKNYEPPHVDLNSLPIKDILLHLLTKEPLKLSLEFDDYIWDLVKSFDLQGMKVFDNFKAKLGQKRYKLLIESASRIPKLFAFKPKIAKVQKPIKSITVIVLGVTGAGKSSMINLLYIMSKGITNIRNMDEVIIHTKYMRGIQDKSDYRLAQNQNQSQTKECNIYKFRLEDEQIIYDLKFMDTPGTGDVDGIKKDDEHINKIVETIAKTPELNSLIIMVNGSSPRIDSKLKYCIQKLIGILPNVVNDNLILLQSNVPHNPNLQSSELKQLRLSSDKIFFFDNPVFSLDIPNATEDEIDEMNHSYTKARKSVYKMLQRVSKMSTKDTEHFKDLKEKRDQFKDQISLMTRNIAELYDQKKKIQAKIVEINKMRDQQQKLDLEKISKMTRKEWVQEPTPDYNTRCASCNSNCHPKCGLQEMQNQGDSGFKSCYAFGGGDSCKKCLHDFSKHLHLRSVWKEYEIVEEIIKEDIMAMIKDVKSSVLTEVDFIRGFKAKMEEIQANIATKRDKIIELVHGIREICSEFNYEKEIDCTIEILQEQLETPELQGKKDSIIETIEQLTTLKKKVFLRDDSDTKIDYLKSIVEEDDTADSLDGKKSISDKENDE